MKLNERLRIGIRTLVLFSAVGISPVVAGVNYYFQSDKTDFSKTSSYLVNGVEPVVLPGADDLVYLPDAPSTGAFEDFSIAVAGVRPFLFFSPDKFWHSPQL